MKFGKMDKTNHFPILENEQRLTQLEKYSHLKNFRIQSWQWCCYLALLLMLPSSLHLARWHAGSARVEVARRTSSKATWLKGAQFIWSWEPHSWPAALRVKGKQEGPAPPAAWGSGHCWSMHAPATCMGETKESPCSWAEHIQRGWERSQHKVKVGRTEYESGLWKGHLIYWTYSSGRGWKS